LVGDATIPHEDLLGEENRTHATLAKTAHNAVLARQTRGQRDFSLAGG
jgi:hypothetical protein